MTVTFWSRHCVVAFEHHDFSYTENFFLTAHVMQLAMILTKSSGLNVEIGNESPSFSLSATQIKFTNMLFVFCDGCG